MHVMWPHLARPQQAMFWIVGQSLPVMESITGAETVIPRMGAKWRGTVTFALKGSEAHIQWEAFIASMEGRIGTTLAHVCSWVRPLDLQGRDAAHRDVVGFADGSAEHWGLSRDPAVTFQLADAAVTRATRVTLVRSNSIGIRPGQIFGIGNRAYKAQLVWRDGANQVVQFQPPLRSGWTAGTQVIGDIPVCEMRLMDAQSGSIPTIRVPFQTVTLELIEAI